MFSRKDLLARTNRKLAKIGVKALMNPRSHTFQLWDFESGVRVPDVGFSFDPDDIAPRRRRARAVPCPFEKIYAMTLDDVVDFAEQR
jgi:hypothetical protein